MTAVTLSSEEISNLLNGDKDISVSDLRSLVREYLTDVLETRDDLLRGIHVYRLSEHDRYRATRMSSLTVADLNELEVTL